VSESSTSSDDLFALLKSYVGREAGPPHVAADPVNLPMIRHWVEAMDDDNPVYIDEKTAASSVHGGIVAPPAMLQAWGMKGLKPNLPDGPSALDELMDTLNRAGFTSVVATNCEQTYDRYLHPGDHLVGSAFIESVSQQKTTALGTGHFITTRTIYETKQGERVGSMTFRILKFSPASTQPKDKESAK